MISKLENFERKYEELNKQLFEIKIPDQLELHKSIMKELKEINPIVEKFREYKSRKKELEDCNEILSNESDQDLKQLANQEIRQLNQTIESILDELNKMLTPKDPNDSKNAIVEIRAGIGGDEAALFASTLFKIYNSYSQKQGWKIEILNINETDLGGIKEVSFMVSGSNVYGELKLESGVHRVKRIPKTESQGRIHTSTVTVAVLPEVEDVEVNIKPDDLRIDTFRSHGAGGQHVNTTDSAIRITHIPSGVVVECQDERSQYKNKDKAMKVLKLRLLKIKQEEQAQDSKQTRNQLIGNAERSAWVRTYNFHTGLFASRVSTPIGEHITKTVQH